MVKLIRILFLSVCIFILNDVGFTFSLGKKKIKYLTSNSLINNERKIKNCGYKSCAKVDPTKLNIHIVAHSHDDVGWLKTVDQYFFGKRNDIQKADVHKILSSSFESLQRNPERRFIYVETSFLWMWWVRQSNTSKAVVRSLINEGRLEIIGGGWSMNDEAVTHYQSIIDQFTLGFSVLNDNFGVCARPKIGWQIDPFGHSREQASLFAQMGFDGLLFGRLDYQDKNERMKTQTMEMIWKGSPSLGASSNLFTSVLYNMYSPPAGFCFDILCSDAPLIDDAESPDYNIERRVQQFLSYVEEQNSSYRTNNIIITMGGDFTYQEAESWFSNLDILIKSINNLYGSKYNAFYSTPSCYLKAVHDAKLSWSTKTDDFFPYASDSLSYWTGYYTSRPTIKFYERMGNNFLQIVKQLLVLNNVPNNKELNRFRRAMGILQHHDAVTGTEKQHVADDYSRILSISMKEGIELSANALRNMMKEEKNSLKEDSIAFHSCLQLNISACEHTENNEKFVVTVYNPTSQEISFYVRIPVTGTSFQVVDYIGTVLETQVVPIPEGVLNIPGRESSAVYDLVFFAKQIPPLGYQSFYISKENKESEIDSNESYTDINSNTWIASVDSNGKIVLKSKTDRILTMLQSFQSYVKYGEHKFRKQSGAYVFRPETRAFDISYKGYYKIFKGPLVQEIHLTLNDYISQVVRIYNGDDRIEFNWLVGPIDNNDEEIVTKYKTILNSKNKFYTDSNGRDMIQRKTNKRKTWHLNVVQPIAGNYYPVTTKICLKDHEKKLQLTILTDRSQGGTSLKSGEIELMIHRRLSRDDGFGVGEALDEMAYGTGLVARGEHSVFFGRRSSEFKLNEKNEAIRLAHRPWIFISPVRNISYKVWKNAYKMLSAGLLESLPPNVQILTLEPWKSGSVLLRLEHIFELKESEKYSVPVDVNIQKLFAAFIVNAVGETTLGGNQWLKNKNRLKWKSNENNDNLGNDDFIEPLNLKNRDKIIVQLKPRQIRTFIVKLSYRKEFIFSENEESESEKE